MQKGFLYLSIWLFLAACTGGAKHGAAETVYADYQVSGEEGRETVTCLIRFYENSPRGTTLLLEPPAAVTLDGAVLRGDSARLSGAYYEVQQPLNGFAGTHTLVFKNAEGKAYPETFDFEPLVLTSEPGETVARGDIVLQVSGAKAAEPVRVLLTDTSFATTDINELQTVENGELRISRAALRNVASGPVTLHLFKEVERRLKNAPGGGGKLSITYGLSREFDLVD